MPESDWSIQDCEIALPHEGEGAWDEGDLLAKPGKSGNPSHYSGPASAKSDDIARSTEGTVMAVAASLAHGDLSQSLLGIGSSMPMAWRWLMCTASCRTLSRHRRTD
jgi:hypothetical protein